MGGVLAWLGAALLAAAPESTADVSPQIDEIVGRSLQEAKLAFAPPADDATIFRRLWLDLAGRTPPAAEARKALAGAKPLARAELVEQLLASPEAANHWARIWAEYYLDSRPFENDGYNGRLLQRHLFQAFQAGKPYNEIARELLEGDGPSDVSGPANWLMRYEASPPRLAGAVSEKFLGCTLQCAECHDHPHEHWKQDDFWGLAAYFARLRRMTPVEEPEGDAFSVVLERRRGELKVPDPNAKPAEDGTQPTKTVFPRKPGEAAIDMAENRRGALIDWLTGPNNPYFARHFVNRTWRQFFGEDLTLSLDGVTIPPSATSSANPAVPEPALAQRKREILDLLTADFVASGYDIQRLLRTIVLSQTYQQSCAPLAHAKPDGKPPAELESLQVRYLARFPIRPLSADQLYLSVAQATGYRGDDYDVRLAEVTEEDFSADLPGQYFGTESLLLARLIALLNGDFAHGAADMAAASSQRINGESAGARHIEWLFFALLSRRPTVDEAELMLDLAGSSDGGLPDVAWTLLNAAEFNTIH